MTLIGATAIKELKKQEFRVLQAIEIGMRNAQYVELDIIARYAGYSVSETERWLQSCHKLDLVHRWTGHFVGYELTIHGYDALALNALYTKGAIQSLGREKGVGKESRVFFALDNQNNEVILKLHRVGFTSFHQVKKKRRYTASKKHISELYSSRLSAETELQWMKTANKLGLSVPNVYDHNRHILVLEYIDGIDLVKLNKLPDPISTLDSIFKFIEIAWKQGHFVHGDLSEHNIIMRHEDALPVVIDFPQAVESTHPNAKQLLLRDIQNITTYFDRKHGIQTDVDSVLDYMLTK